jgi:DNA-binding transcriptional ArsR family regulator
VVKYDHASLDSVFAALADPTRRAIAERLAGGELSVTELAEPFGVTLPAILKHVRVLEHAGVLEHRKERRVRYCRLVPGALEDAARWIGFYRAFWSERLGSLHEHLAKEELDG